ncbi:MAG: TonB-dependent receptor [Ignavibacteriales bacterium]|nr:TonB-dependent receptor [Ignavibacteriales bacterium]
MRIFYFSKFIINAALWISISGSLVFAANGKITGRITDKQTGESVPSANIIITHVILSNGSEVPVNFSRGAAADPEGYYFILDVPPGKYTIKASSIGFSSVTQKDVEVGLDRTISLNFQLSSTAIEVNQVVVTAKREIVKQDVSGTQEVIATERIEHMPVLRVDEFIGKIKGVELQSGAEGNGLSVRGGAIRETDVRLDGISLQDPRTENSYLALNSTSIQEIQILTGGFQAKYGGIRSGLLNVVTKDGSRDRYQVSIKMDVAPKNQKRYFGTNPWSNESWIYRVYADTSANGYAFRGVPKGDTTVPFEFRSFKGWGGKTPRSGEKLLDSVQNWQLWKAQHPQYTFQDKPDYYIEGSISGPIPGSFIPIWSEFADRTTFLLAWKYENSQLSFPVGPRNNYEDWNGQLKLTTILPNMKLSVNGMYSKINTVSGGRTTSYGGALQDYSQSFSFLNSTSSSVTAQAGLIGGGNYRQLFNRSRLQFYDQRLVVGGAKLTHTLNPAMFYTLDFQVGYTDQSLQPFRMDTTGGKNLVSFYSEKKKTWYSYSVPNYGTPNASTNLQPDVLNTYDMYGGIQRIDSSYSYVYQFKGDYTAQLGRHHQIEAGFSARLQDMFVYAGTWLQTQLSYTPNTWQYYKAKPLEMGVYLQDKIEFEGLVLNAGLRLDYLNPNKGGFSAKFPLDEEYIKLYNETYLNLPGEEQSFERWKEWRQLLDSPPGWPRTENKIQVYLSPRMGVSFPITETSKMYFNYGHFYQRPPISFMYNLYINPGSVTVPTPDLNMAKTVSYEFGYEQLFLADFLVNVTAYYKDVSNEPLARTFINYFENNQVTQYFPDAYKDIRGVEVRFEKPVGRFVSFNAMYDYRLTSAGQSGLAVVYENRLKAREGELRSAFISTSEPLPRANINLNLHTPDDFGPEWLGTNWLGGLFANFFFEWKDGGRILLNPEEADIKNRIYVDVVNYWNLDFRGSALFSTPWGSLELVVTIQNLTNNKWLSTGNMTTSQLNDYKQSLKTPDKGGNDKWGEYDKPYIKTGWYDAPLFLNPRRIVLGFRLNL